MSDPADKLRDILELTDCGRGQWEPLLDALVAERAELEIDRNDWKRISDEAEATAEARLRVRNSAIARAEAAEARQEGYRKSVEANAAARVAAEAERDDLLHAFQEIWDDWCSGHMGDCNCVVCSLTADALNIDRAALAKEDA